MTLIHLTSHRANWGQPLNCSYTPQFPASSPFVVSVGGTCVSNPASPHDFQLIAGFEKSGPIRISLCPIVWTSTSQHRILPPIYSFLSTHLRGSVTMYQSTIFHSMTV